MADLKDKEERALRDAESAEAREPVREGSVEESPAKPEGAELTEEEAAEAEAAEQVAKENRKERRRKKKRPGAEDAEPADRNARVRSQLMQKRVAAEQAQEPLTTGEMVDDAIARGVASSSKWLRQNGNFLQYAVVAIIVAGAGYGVWYWRTTGSAESASAQLMVGVMADRGRVLEDDAPAKQPEDEEVVPTFKTAEARSDTALAAYRKVETSSPGTGAAILARLGEAGELLDKKKYDEALSAYRDVKASPLGNADPDVKGRSLEGIGFALEGKGDKDAALKAFHELEIVTQEKGFKELGMFHQARLLAAKGEKDKALALIKDARDRLQTTSEGKAVYLRGVLDDLGAALDPGSVAKKGAPGGAGKQMSAEELQKLMQMQMQLQKAKQQGEGPAPSPKK